MYVELSEGARVVGLEMLIGVFDCRLSMLIGLSMDERCADVEYEIRGQVLTDFLPSMM